MAEAHLGNGASFTFTGTSGTVTTLGGVLSISGPDAQRDTVDATQLGSTTPWRVYVKGDGTPGTVNIECLYDNIDGTQIALNEVIAGTTLPGLRIFSLSSVETMLVVASPAAT